MAQLIEARAYMECSALLNDGVDAVFETATRAAMTVRSEGVGGKRAPRRESTGIREKGDSSSGCGCVIC